MLSPFAPHVAEEIWSRLGNTETLAYEEWPAFNEEYLKEDVIEMAVQVNGKVRANIQVPAEKMKDKAYGLELARKQKNVSRYLEGTTVLKEIFVPGRIINFVRSEERRVGKECVLLQDNCD